MNRLLASFACLVIMGSAAKGAPTITTFTVQGATDVFPRGMNNHGQVVGEWNDANGDNIGFLRNPDGSIVTIYDPITQDTSPSDIDSDGNITGSAGFCDRSWRCNYAFLRTAAGVFSNFKNYSSCCVKTHGWIAGTRKGYEWGFLRNPTTGKIKKFYVGGKQTLVTAMNSAETVVGGYYDGGPYAASFIRTVDGKVTTFGVDGAQSEAMGINENGEVIGYYDKPGFHAYIRTSDGKMTRFDVPGAAQTLPVALNKNGVIAGAYYGSDTVAHAFIRAPDGTFTYFDVPGASSTFPQTMNQNGDVAGYYTDQNGNFFGFIRTP